MVDQPNSPPNSSDHKTQNPVPHVESTVGNVNDASIGSIKEKSEASVFVNSEPIREEQVQNAVKFLSHPKVRGSPVQYRRSFLEKKGLTKEEIDEAFTRVPDPTPTVSSSQAVVANQDGLKTSPSIQPQVLSQTQQQTPGVHGAASVSKFGTLSRFHWTHALLAVGVLAASGAGTAVLLKKSIIPRLKSWIRKVVIEEEAVAATDKSFTFNKPSLEEEATAAAKSAATAAADVARASQEMLIAKTEEKKYFEELTKLLNIQVTEMKSMSNALQKLEGQSNASVMVTTVDNEDQQIPITSSQQMYTNGKVDAYSVKSPPPPAFVESSVAPHPKSYMEIMGMIERGEKPPNIREINDQPPNPNQPVPNPRLAPKLKPWEIGQSQMNSVNGVQYQESNSHGVSMFSSQTSQFNGDGGSAAPWSQNKNLKITEIETEDNQKTGSSSSVFNERPPPPPVQRSWVPPQPPPVAMQEAAAAIRQPKKPPTQRQQQYTTDDQLLSRSSSSEITDDLQRTTEISESGGTMINNLDGGGGGGGGGVSHGFSSSEIQQEDGNSYVEA